MKTMKRSMVLAIAAVAMMSTNAIAERPVSQARPEANGPAKLSDAELDNITAGSAFVGVGVFNTGTASVLQINNAGTNAHCVNCVPNPFGGNARVILIQNPAQTVFKCMGAAVC
jgi:hypothetical protein